MDLDKVVFTTELGSILKKTESLKADLETLLSTNSSLHFYVSKLMVKLTDFGKEYSEDKPTTYACPICFQNERNYVIVNCGHGMCEDCCKKSIERRHRCPICRGPASKLLKIFV